MPETPASRADMLARRFGYDDWVRGQTAGSLFVWNASLGGDELPGMVMQRVKRLDVETVVGPRPMPEGIRDAAADAPRVLVQSLWRDARRSGVLIRVDVFECASATCARERALWMLGEFESPLIGRTDGVGEVALASRGDGLILFVRGNLTCLLRNVDRRSVSVRQAALALDAAALGTKDEQPRPVLVPKLRPPSKDRAARIVEATLQDVDTASPERQASLKFVAPEGEIALRDGAIVYSGPRSGLERLVVYERRT